MKSKKQLTIINMKFQKGHKIIVLKTPLNNYKYLGTYKKK